MEIITKTAQVILHLVALITCICKPWLIIVFLITYVSTMCFFSYKHYIYLSIYPYIYLFWTLDPGCLSLPLFHWKIQNAPLSLLLTEKSRILLPPSFSLKNPGFPSPPPFHLKILDPSLLKKLTLLSVAMNQPTDYWLES